MKTPDLNRANLQLWQCWCPVVGFWFFFSPWPIRRDFEPSAPLFFRSDGPTHTPWPLLLSFVYFLSHPLFVALANSLPCSLYLSCHIACLTPAPWFANSFSPAPYVTAVPVVFMLPDPPQYTPPFLYTIEIVEITVFLWTRDVILSCPSPKKATSRPLSRSLPPPTHFSLPTTY